MNKGSGGDGIPTELFQILKDDAVKVLHSICQQIWKTQQSGESQFSFQSQRKRNANRQNACLRRPYKIAEKGRDVKGKGEKKKDILI